MTPFSRICIGETTSKGPKGDRKGTEGDRRSQRSSLSNFVLPPVPRPLSRRLLRAPKKDRMGTEGASRVNGEPNTHAQKISDHHINSRQVTKHIHP